MSKGLHITVMLGGPSAEREVSLRSGKSVAKALRSLGHEVTELDPQPGWKLADDTQVVFLALHGAYGEDGTVQRELDAQDIPYTGCDAEASRLGFDKLLTKMKCAEVGVPMARHEVINSVTAPWPAGWEPPVVLKPLRSGSSLGLQFVERIEDWSKGLAASLAHDTEVLMEEKIVGRETTVGILGTQILPVMETRTKAGVFDYHNKYTPGAVERFCPAPFDEATTHKIQQAAFSAFKAIGGRDYSRVDVMVRPNGDPIVLEVNTLPGMTETSSLPKAAAVAGIEFPRLCQMMIDMALRRDSARILK